MVPRGTDPYQELGWVCNSGYRSCSAWEHFHHSLERAQEVLEKNQYPPGFYEPIIEKALSRIREPVKKPAAATPESETSQAKHRVLLQYRGLVTDKFVKRPLDCGAPAQIVLTLRKLKTCLPSLKPTVSKMLKSNIVYRVTCPRCQAYCVGKTSRHFCIRYGEEMTQAKEAVFKHMRACGGAKQLTDENVDVLASVTKGAFQLAIMEALYIRELCPALNTKDEYRDHELSLKF